MAQTSPEQIAQILVLNGLNWSYDEIAAEVGVSPSTVGSYVNTIEEESKEPDATPESVFISYYIDGKGSAIAERIASNAL